MVGTEEVDSTPARKKTHIVETMLDYHIDKSVHDERNIGCCVGNNYSVHIGETTKTS